MTDEEKRQAYLRQQPNPEHLTCCCCGNGLWGRQWWNRDTGYGLCNGCIEYCGVKPNEDYNRSYGYRGIHFGLPNQDTDPVPDVIAITGFNI
jgi:hypothetical protein